MPFWVSVVSRADRIAVTGAARTRCGQFYCEAAVRYTLAGPHRIGKVAVKAVAASAVRTPRQTGRGGVKEREPCPRRAGQHTREDFHTLHGSGRKVQLTAQIFGGRGNCLSATTQPVRGRRGPVIFVARIASALSLSWPDPLD